MTTCLIELHRNGEWHPAARLELRSGSRDHETPTWLEYDVDYVSDALGARDHRAVSVRFPVDYVLHNLPSFPAFVMDILPQGEARRDVVARLRAEDKPAGEWDILLAGARNPVGNLRVAEAVSPTVESTHGVALAEIVDRGDAFRAWAEQQDIPMTGSSDTGGASPKLLMTADANGRLHADGALPDARAHRHFILKFPRGRTRRDAAVLANEAPYLEVLRALGCHCAAPLAYHEGTLVIPRFDRRRVDGSVERLGMESAYAMLGIVEPGARLAFETVCEQLARVVHDPARDVLELVLRDAAALALGNTDNHGRNTSLLKHADGRVELSPVYDFAPMFLDPELVVRQTLWRTERRGGLDWNDVATSIGALVPDVLPRARIADALRDFGVRLAEAPTIMRDAGVDAEVIEQRRPHIASVASGLSHVEVR